MMNSSTNRFLIGAPLALALGTSAFEASYSSDRVGAFDEDQAMPVLEVPVEDPIQVHLKNDKRVQRVVHLGDLNLAELPDDADLITEIEHDVIVDAGFSGSRVSVSELLPCLTTVGGSVQINGNNDLLSVDLTGISTVGSSVQINSNDALRFIDLSSINVVGAVQVLLNPALLSIYTIDLFAGGLQVDDGVTQCSQVKTHWDNLDLVSLPTDAHLITRVAFSVLVNSSFTEQSIDFAADLPCLRVISGNFRVKFTGVTSIDTGILQKTTIVEIQGNSGLSNFDMSSLQSASNVVINQNPKVSNFDMASLQSAAGQVLISPSMLSNINLPSLESASSITIDDNQDLQAVDLSKLLYNSQRFHVWFSNNPKLDQVRLDSYCCGDNYDCEPYVDIPPDVDVEFPTDCRKPQM